MTDQAFVIDHINGRIFETIKQLEEKTDKKGLLFYHENVNNYKDDTAGEGIYLSFLGLEPVYLGNQFERIQKKEINKDGKEVEFLVLPASQFKCSYMIRPLFQSQSDIVKFLGLIIRHMKDNSKLDVGNHDWAGNNALPALITLKPGMELMAQLSIFNQLGIRYTPSLFYDVIVGIDSDQREEFGRVKERKIDTGAADKEEMANKRKK
jgi:hypothetical protein